MKAARRLVSVVLTMCLVLCCLASSLAVEAATNVGTLTVFAYNDGGSSSWNTSGHAFLAFENTSNSKVTIGGLTVKSGEGITFGTWGNQSAHNGIWYNLESYFINVLSESTNHVSLSTSVTSDDVSSINTIIAENDKWGLFNNCSSFAVKVWNEVSSTTLSAGFPNTPTSLMSDIKSNSDYKTGRTVPKNNNIGYVDNGEFVPVTVTTYGLSRNTVVAEDDVVFTVDINFNPNSCNTEVWYK